MRCEQQSWSAGTGWGASAPNLPDANLVLYFGARSALACGERHRELQRAYPSAQLLGCSTGGHILDDHIEDEGVVATALSFDATSVRLATAEVSGPADSHACGVALGRALAADDLAGVFLLSDGLNVNGSALVVGVGAALGPAVPLSGGLAGDGPHFGSTLVGAGENLPREKLVAAVGFYGKAIRMGHGSAGGWENFGPRRRVTRSEGNVLFELDGEPALDLYERYLGEEAAGLPSTALLYPLRVWDPAQPRADVVRTVLGVDRTARTMTFAGDIPQGWLAQLMRGRFERLIAGAGEASALAMNGVQAGPNSGDSVAIMVSCIGRKLLMGQTTTDEISAAMGCLSPGMKAIGFYSYGEIAPHAGSGSCELHNQSMTVTALAEAAPV